MSAGVMGKHDVAASPGRVVGRQRLPPNLGRVRMMLVVRQSRVRHPHGLQFLEGLDEPGWESLMLDVLNTEPIASSFDSNSV